MFIQKSCIKICGLSKQMVSFGAAVLITSVAACTPPPNFADNLNQYKSVAVISLLPRTITMYHVGFTVFQNDAAVFPLDWNPNTLALKTAKAILSQNYQIKDLNVDTGAFAAAVQSNYSMLDLGDTEGLVIDQLRATVKPGQVDLVIVVYALVPPSYITINGNYGEAGLMSTSGIGGYATKDDQVHLNASLEVFDGRTFDHIAVISTGPSDVSMSDLKWRGRSYGSLTDEQKQKLTAIEQQVVRDFVATSLNGVHLVND